MTAATTGPAYQAFSPRTDHHVEPREVQIGRSVTLARAGPASDRRPVAAHSRHAGHSRLAGHKQEADRRVMELHPRLRRDREKLPLRVALPWWQSQ